MGENIFLQYMEFYLKDTNNYLLLVLLITQWLTYFDNQINKLNPNKKDRGLKILQISDLPLFLKLYFLLFHDSHLNEFKHLKNHKFIAYLLYLLLCH
jgi:hypothetical protein